MRKEQIILALGFALVAHCRGDVVVTTPLHVGGFFDGGGADNHIEHQNYFVGYGTVGGVRTTERRSFFWYHVPDFSGPVLDVAIKLKMLVSTSLIFGAGPDPLVHDDTETFRLGATSIAPSTMVSPTLSAAEAQTIFDAMDDHAIAPDYDFHSATPYSFPFTVEMHLDEVGKALISTHRGGDVVLTGWMPSWSYDARMDAGGHFLEGDELLFGFSDVPTLVPAPEMAIVYAPVPEPASFAVLALGAAALHRRRR